MRLFSRKPAYTQEEISEQIGQIADIMKLRKATTNQAEIDRFTTEVEMAQLVLDFMLSEVAVSSGIPDKQVA